MSQPNESIWQVCYQRGARHVDLLPAEYGDQADAEACAFEATTFSGLPHWVTAASLPQTHQMAESHSGREQAVSCGTD